jgi:hypothetical protein
MAKPRLATFNYEILATRSAYNSSSFSCLDYNVHVDDLVRCLWKFRG